MNEHSQIIINLEFNNDIINWINKEYPERNWFLAENRSLFRVGTNLFECYRSFGSVNTNNSIIEIEKIELNLEKEIEVFFKKTAENHIKFIHVICQEILEMTDIKDLYLRSVVGELEYSGDTSIYANWTLYAKFDDEGS